MVNYLRIRLGRIIATMVITSLATMISVTLSYFIWYFFAASPTPNLTILLTCAAVCPLIIASSVSYCLLRQQDELDKSRADLQRAVMYSTRLCEDQKIIHEAISTMDSINSGEIGRSLICAVKRIVPDIADILIRVDSEVIDSENLDFTTEIAKESKNSRVDKPTSIYLDKNRNWLVQIHGDVNPTKRWMLETICQHAAAMFKNAQLHKDMETKALYDGLTGIFNRRAIEDRLDVEMSRCGRSGHSLALLMIDIDHFKQINDAYGHNVGDLVLAGVAKLLIKSVRVGDVCGRWGGEEFILLIVDLSEENLPKIAENVRKSVEKKEFKCGTNYINVTISVGATLLRLEENADDFKKRADNLLYLAKQEGRNRVLLDLRSQ